MQTRDSREKFCHDRARRRQIEAFLLFFSLGFVRFCCRDTLTAYIRWWVSTRVGKGREGGGRDVWPRLKRVKPHALVGVVELRNVRP